MKPRIRFDRKYNLWRYDGKHYGTLQAAYGRAELEYCSSSSIQAQASHQISGGLAQYGSLQAAYGRAELEYGNRSGILGPPLGIIGSLESLGYFS